MARADLKLPDEFLTKLSRLGKDTDSVAEKVLEVGGQVVLAKVRSNLAAVIGSGTKYDSRSTGELAQSLGLSPVKLNREGNHDIKIGFSEPRSDGGSNAKIANILEYGNVLIGLMQLGTRCSDGSCEAAEDLISGFSAIEAEAELVQIGLKLCAAAVISAEQECFQVADGFVQPVQVARFILFRVQLHARQVPIASVAVTFDFCTCRNSFADDLLKCFARDVFHDLHPREQRSPVFRF